MGDIPPNSGPGVTGPYIAAGPIGLADTYRFNYQLNYVTRNTWSARNALPNMSQRRWYPTLTTLANGDALAIAGQQWTTTAGTNVAVVPEVWEASSYRWRRLTNISLALPDYPWMHLALDGTVFNAGPNPATGFLGTAGAGTWTPALAPVSRNRAGGNDTWVYGNSVMYQPGRILNLGGGLYSSVNKGTELIDISNGAAGPTYFGRGADMIFPRKHANSTILADGSVLVVGGSTDTESVADEVGVLHPELWFRPGKLWPLGYWQVLAPMAVPRMYHSTAVLLPDGTVFVGGGGLVGTVANHPDYQVFTPPYLLRPGTTRPVIQSAPLSVQYAQSFQVQTPDVATIAQATLVRLSSVTHSFNMNQRFMNLVVAFDPTQGNQLTLAAPANANVAPPGHYMLFLLNADGVPSVASIVHVSANACNVPPVALAVADVPGTQTDCSVRVRVTAVNDPNLAQGTDYRWSVNGVRVPAADDQAILGVTCTRGGSSMLVRCEITPAQCAGAAAVAQTTVARFFPNCPPRLTPGGN